MTDPTGRPGEPGDRARPGGPGDGGRPGGPGDGGRPGGPGDGGHGEWHALAAGWALSTLDSDDEARFAAHLPGCDRCAGTVRESLHTVADLAYAVPDEEPPPALKDRIMAAVRGEPRRRPAAPAGTAPPPDSGAQPEGPWPHGAEADGSAGEGTPADTDWFSRPAPRRLGPPAVGPAGEQPGVPRRRPLTGDVSYTGRLREPPPTGARPPGSARPGEPPVPAGPGAPARPGGLGRPGEPPVARPSPASGERPSSGGPAVAGGLPRGGGPVDSGGPAGPGLARPGEPPVAGPPVAGPPPASGERPSTGGPAVAGGLPRRGGPVASGGPAGPGLARPGEPPVPAGPGGRSEPGSARPGAFRVAGGQAVSGGVPADRGPARRDDGPADGDAARRDDPSSPRPPATGPGAVGRRGPATGAPERPAPAAARSDTADHTAGEPHPGPARRPASTRGRHAAIDDTDDTDDPGTVAAFARPARRWAGWAAAAAALVLIAGIGAWNLRLRADRDDLRQVAVQRSAEIAQRDALVARRDATIRQLTRNEPARIAALVNPVAPAQARRATLVVRGDRVEIITEALGPNTGNTTYWLWTLRCDTPTPSDLRPVQGFTLSQARFSVRDIGSDPGFATATCFAISAEVGTARPSAPRQVVAVGRPE